MGTEELGIACRREEEEAREEYGKRSFTMSEPLSRIREVGSTRLIRETCLRCCDG